MTTVCQASTFGSNCRGVCSAGSSCDRFNGRCQGGDVCEAGWTDYPKCDIGRKYLYLAKTIV